MVDETILVKACKERCEKFRNNQECPFFLSEKEFCPVVREVRKELAPKDEDRDRRP